MVMVVHSGGTINDRYFSEGRYLDAIDCYTTALKLCPAEDEYAYNRAVYFSNRAACLSKIGRTEEAIEDCSQAIELSPTYVKARS
jgi:tetratricopeptide (TPR) repeat protein